MAGPFERRDWPLAVLLLALAAVYLPATWSDQLGSLGGDSAVYLLSAQSYAPWLPADPVVEAIAVESQFPPLYPVLLMLAGGATDLRLAHALTTLFLLVAFALGYAWFVRLGVPRAVATAGVALFAAMPGTFQRALYLLSESLYLSLVLGFLLVLAWSRDPPGTRRLALAALLAAAAMMTRTVGVTLLPALVLWLWRGRVPPGRALAALLATVLPSIVWAAVRAPEQSYGAGMLMHYARFSPLQVLEQFWIQASALAMGLAANVLQTAQLLGVALALGVVAAAIAVTRLVRLQPDAWAVAAYAGLIAIWPFPDEGQRFAWPLVLPLLGYGLLAAEPAAARWPRLAPLVRALLPAALALAVLPSAIATAQRWHDPLLGQFPRLRHLPEFYEADRRSATSQARLHLEVADALTQLPAAVPPGECVWSIKPSLVALLGHRDSFVPPFEHVDDATFNAWIAAKGCRWFLLLGSASPSYSAMYPMGRMRGRLEVLEAYASRRDDTGRVVAALAVLKPPGAP